MPREWVIDDYSGFEGLRLCECEREQPGPNEVRLRIEACLLYTSPSPRDGLLSRMPSSA